MVVHHIHRIFNYNTTMNHGYHFQALPSRSFGRMHVWSVWSVLHGKWFFCCLWMSETVRRTSVPQFSYCCPRTIRIRLSHIRFLSRNLALDGLDVFHVYIFHIIYIDTFIKCILRVYIYIYYIVYGGFHKWDSPKMDGFFWSRPCRWPTWSRANYGSQATGAMGMVFIIGIVEIDNS
jgi:hypothetical protein